MSAQAGQLSSSARFLLRAGLVAAWLFGVGGGVSSCERLFIYRGPFPAVPRADAPATSARAATASASAAPVVAASASAVPAPSASLASAADVSPAASASAPPAAARPSLAEERRSMALEALDRFRSTRLPLSVANLLLSAALVFAAARTLSRRPGARAWLLQFSIANGLFALVELVASREERAFLIARTLELPEYASNPGLPMARRAMPLVLASFGLVEAVMFLGLAYALSRASVVRELAPRDDDRRTLPPSSADDEDA